MKSADNHFHFIVPVWGITYTELFVEICLPLMLINGNLDSREFTSQDQFVILTTWDNSITIKNSQSYKRLSQIIRTKIILIDGLVSLDNSHKAMSFCYALAMQESNVVPNSTFFIYLTPDSFWSENTFKRLFEIAKTKHKVVMAMGLRTNAEDMSRDILEYFDENDGRLNISNDTILSLVFKNLHQMSKAHNWLSEKFLNNWPSHLYWIDEQKQQIIAHCFHMHPLMVLAPNSLIDIGTTIDDGFVSNLGYPKDSFYIATTEFFGIEMSPSERSWNQKLAAPNMVDVSYFSIKHTNNLHWHFFNHRIIIGKSSAVEIELSNLISAVTAKIRYNRDSKWYSPLKLMIHLKILKNVLAKITKVPKKILRIPKKLIKISRSFYKKDITLRESDIPPR